MFYQLLRHSSCVCTALYWRLPQRSHTPGGTRRMYHTLPPRSSVYTAPRLLPQGCKSTTGLPQVVWLWLRLRTAKDMPSIFLVMVKRFLTQFLPPFSLYMTVGRALWTYHPCCLSTAICAECIRNGAICCFGPCFPHTPHSHCVSTNRPFARASGF